MPMTRAQAEQIVRRCGPVAPDLDLACEIYEALHGREPDEHGTRAAIWSACQRAVEPFDVYGSTDCLRG